MAVSWKSWPNLFCICFLLCATEVVLLKFQLEPLNVSVLQGSDAQFRAIMEGEWKELAWFLNTTLVLVVSANGKETKYMDQFSAEFCSMGNNNCVEFTIHNASRHNTGPVTCAVLGVAGTKTAYLYVQENGTVTIMEANLTVTQDQQVEFQCLTTAWFPRPTVDWTFDGQAVNSNLYNTTSMEDGDFFNSTSVLKFKAVHNTTVECLATVPALKNPQSSSVFLIVVPKPPDWTVLIAVVVSFGGVALLVLLIIGIIFCCKHSEEKQTNYQDEMRKVKTRSQISSVTGAGQRQGQENAGHVLEGVTPSDKDFVQAHGHDTFKIPDVGNSNQIGNVHNTTTNIYDTPGFRKHRHVTIV